MVTSLLDVNVLIALAAVTEGVLGTLEKRILNAVRGTAYEASVISLWD